MSRQEHPGAGEDFQAEVSDVGPRTGGAPTAPAHSPLEPRLTPRRRLVRLAITLSAGLLTLAVVLGSIPSVRGGVTGLVAGLIPTPTPTLTPGSDLFYLLPNPPGVDVSLDGRALAHPPFPGDPHPLQLTPGRHLFAWRSHVFPIPPLRCTVSVPHVPGVSVPRVPGDSCPFVSQAFLQEVHVSLPGAIIALHGSLAALAPGDATSLAQAIQAALNASRSTALVQPGGRYFYYQPGQAGAPAVAQQPLRATLSYQFVTDSSYPEPCLGIQPAVPCRFPVQDCSQLCTVTQPPPSVAGSPAAWVVVAVVRGTWDYLTLEGHVVAQHLVDGFGHQLAVLRITWDGAAWQAAPNFGHTPGLDVADDAVCDPAREALSQTPDWGFQLTNPSVGAQVQFASDATPADGCVALLYQPPVPSQPAVFLERFGVLLTVNDVARIPGDNLPVADAAEQRLAQQLMAELQP
jgi:hypothetical protein